MHLRAVWTVLGVRRPIPANKPPDDRFKRWNRITSKGQVTSDTIQLFGWNRPVRGIAQRGTVGAKGHHGGLSPRTASQAGA